MSKLSEKIKKQAKSNHRKNRSLKLTEHQKRIAISYGYASFKALLKSERNSEIEARKTFALKGNTQSKIQYPSVGKGIEIFIREDGLRGLRATRDFKASELIIIDDLLIGYNITYSPLLQQNRAWAMTELLFQPSSKGYVEAIIDRYHLRDSHQPKFGKEDDYLIEFIRERTNKKPEYIKYIYSIVVTYHATLTCTNYINSQSEFVYLSAAMMFMNHSCDANAAIAPKVKVNPTRIDGISLSEPEIIALKDIQEGEEITWNYEKKFVELNFKERRKKLKELFSFDCKCHRCYRERFLINK